MLYRVDLKKNELYDAFEFTVNEKGLLETLVYFHSERVEKDYGDGEDQQPIDVKVKPRLEIIFSDYQVSVKANESEFTEKSIAFHDNRMVSLPDKYKSYKVKDYRTDEKVKNINNK